jgi:hypothetical protein
MENESSNRRRGGGMKRDDRAKTDTQGRQPSDNKLDVNPNFSRLVNSERWNGCFGDKHGISKSHGSMKSGNSDDQPAKSPRNDVNAI